MERKVADISLRIYGHFIDLIFIIIGPVIGFGMLGYDSSQPQGKVLFFQLGCSFLIYIIFTIMEGFGGRTPGKYFAETRVVTTKGNYINVLQSIARNTFRLLDLIGIFYLISLIVMKMSSKRQRIGDYLAGTTVIYEGDDPEYDEDNKMLVMNINYPQPKTTATETENHE